jgi:hypothetical protein
MVLMDFKALYIHNFSNKCLSGEIPSSIGNLKQLELLDLSNNSFVGEIPVHLERLHFLSYLNLSFNHFKGKIPTATQIQSFRACGIPDDRRPDEIHPQLACATNFVRGKDSKISSYL